MAGGTTRGGNKRLAVVIPVILVAVAAPLILLYSVGNILQSQMGITPVPTQIVAEEEAEGRTELLARINSLTVNPDGSYAVTVTNLSDTAVSYTVIATLEDGTIIGSTPTEETPAGGEALANLATQTPTGTATVVIQVADSRTGRTVAETRHPR